MITSFGNHEVHLKDYLYVFRKRRKIFIFFLCFALLSASLITFFEPVLYKATATILIERENPNVVDFKDVMSFDASTTEYYQTQYQMLKSKSLIQKLIQKEKLDQDPYLMRLKKGRLRSLIFSQGFWPAWVREFMTPSALDEIFIRKMLRIDPVRNSRLVEVSILHPDPVRAAEIVNELVELFIQRNLESRYAIATQATGLISDQLVQLKDQVGVAERKLQDYKEAKGLVNIPELRQTNQFLEEARLELVKIQAEEAKLAKRYLEAHPKRIHISSQIQGLEEKIAEEEKRILELNRSAVDYGEIEREAQSARQIYKALLKRLQETTSESRTQASNIMFVDRTEPPTRPHTPRPLINFLIAMVIGVGGGVLAAFFVEYLDSTVRLPDDIEKGLGLDLLGIVPKINEDPRLPARGRLFMTEDSHSPAAEAIRALRTALLFRLRQVKGCRTVLMTSPNPEEGKSTLTLNLAAALAQNHLHIILIDADLRKPMLHRLLEKPHEKGLTDILEGSESEENVIHKNVAGLGFDFISSGTFSKHPAEVLGSQSLPDLMGRLREKYDIILFDSPPYLAVADVVVLNEHAHALVVAACYHKTDRRHLKDLPRRFDSPLLQVLGVVINKVGVKEKDYYYHQYYYYGYGPAAEGKK